MGAYDSIANGLCCLGIEFGSTRIKAILIDEERHPIAYGVHEWENRYENGIWTYSIDDIKNGLASCYGSLKADVMMRYGIVVKRLKAIGISAMMHGYMAFADDGRLLTPFRTWRNTVTFSESEELTELLSYPVPERWTVSHLLYDIRHSAPYLDDISYVMTLASYVHYLLTGVKVAGIGDASGMFPVDRRKKGYDDEAAAIFLKSYDYDVRSLFPSVLLAGENAGCLTEDGALLLDAEGDLGSGIPLCPPEGDAGTGMVATDSVRPRTGNISAGTSAFAMIVLENPLSRPYKELDLVTTPDGCPVAMAHTNNCTGDLDCWIGLFGEVLSLFGVNADKEELYGRLIGEAGRGSADAGGLVSYNYQAGEPISGCQKGIPMFIRGTSSSLNLPDFMKQEMYSAIAAMKSGLDILSEKEHIRADRITCHGGYFKTGDEGLKAVAAALRCPVYALSTAGEGGAWGMALLADYLGSADMDLPSYLDEKVFSSLECRCIEPDAASSDGFDSFYKRYVSGLAAERLAAELLGD